MKSNELKNHFFSHSRNSVLGTPYLNDRVAFLKRFLKALLPWPNFWSEPNLIPVPVPVPYNWKNDPLGRKVQYMPESFTNEMVLHNVSNIVRPEFYNLKRADCSELYDYLVRKLFHYFD